MRTMHAEGIDWPAILADAVNKPGVISKAYSTFWNYSVGNQISALFQCLLREIEPGPIHTYLGWQELGRQVKRGEKAIVLTMPVTVKRKQNEAVPSGDASDTAVAGDGAERPATTASRTIFIERPHWFVLSQTEGKEYIPVSVPEWDERIALHHLQIDRGTFRHTDGNTQGYAAGRTVAVSPIAFMPHRTLFHELAHVFSVTPKNSPAYVTATKPHPATFAKSKPNALP